MTQYAFTPPPVPSVAINNSDRRFAVRRIHCVGQNYAAHAREMGSNPERETPFFFSKPTDAVVDSGSEIPYPQLTQNFHFEIELVVAIGKGGADISVDDALAHIYGYGVGIDFTRRDLQQAAKKIGRPWDWGKGCDHGAPCSPIHTLDDTGPLSEGRIWLAVNGEIKQDANLSDLIWPVADIIAFCSSALRLEPGDLIYTGTPAGVGPVVVGDKITGGIDRLGEIEVSIVD
ncbi:MAG: fumarylacetoacetate hydrolase family protein [Rhizobiaceae bacterium]|nr:fumarylacetoacetate hydrolase family protein [Rhizobiaceae bacterium]